MAVRKPISGRQLLWLAVAVVLLGLAGYAQAEGSAPEVLTLGVRSDCPPFSYFDEATKEYRGYSVDLCRVIALNAQAFLPYQRVAFEPVTAQNRFLKLHQKKIDILCEATTVTQERMRRFGPTMYTFISGASLMYSPNLAKSSKMRVGVLKGTTTENAVRTILDLQTDIDRARTRTFKINSEAVIHLDSLDAFEDKKIDLYIADREILLFLSRMAAQRKIPLVVSKKYYTIEPYALFLRTDDHQLRYIANLTLSDIFKQDIHRIFRDNFPNKRMNDSLRQLFRLQQLLRGSDPLANQ